MKENVLDKKNDRKAERRKKEIKEAMWGEGCER